MASGSFLLMILPYIVIVTCGIPGAASASETGWEAICTVHLCLSVLHGVAACKLTHAVMKQTSTSIIHGCYTKEFLLLYMLVCSSSYSFTHWKQIKEFIQLLPNMLPSMFLSRPAYSVCTVQHYDNVTVPMYKEVTVYYETSTFCWNGWKWFSCDETK